MASKKAKERRERKMGSARKRAETHEAGFSRTAIKVPSNMSMFGLPKKGCRIELIPYEVSVKDNSNAKKGELWFERTYFVHRGVGANEDSFCCPRKNWGKKCPICEHRAKLARDPKSDKDTLKALEPKERQLFNVFDYADEEKGVQLFDVSFHLFGKMVDAKVENGDDGEYDFFFDPDNGFTLKVGTKEKNFQGRSFMEAGDIEFKQRKEPLSDELLNAAADLDTLLIEKSYDELKKIFLQQSDDDDDEDEEEDDDDQDDDEEEDEDDDDEGEDKPSSSKKPSKKSKPSDDDDEDDDEGEDDEDEEEEDEPPKSSRGKKSGKSSKPSSDDEDEEDDEDDEDEVHGDATAKSKGIKVGSVVLHDDYGECEVVHISKDGTSLRLKDEDDDEHKAIGVSEVELKKKSSKKDDDDEEDEKPSKKGGKPKRKDDFEDDEEEEEDDDEDDDPPPKKKKK